MRAFIGLGNPGASYLRTRHNVGYRVIDAWLDRLHLKLRPEGRGFDAESGVIGDQVVLFVKPATFMNQSGRAVVEVLRVYNLDLADIVVVCDDVNLPLGKLRLRGRGSDGGHNGLASIITAVGSEEFARQRLGIGQPQEGMDRVDYVLGRFTPEDEEMLHPVIGRACEQLHTLVIDGLAAAISRYNG